MVLARKSDKGIAITYLVKFHCMVNMWLFPLGVVRSFPTVSIEILSKASMGVSVRISGSLVLQRFIFFSRQVLHLLIKSCISFLIPFQYYLSWIFWYVWLIPLCPPIRLWCNYSIILGLSFKAGILTFPKQIVMRIPVFLYTCCRSSSNSPGSIWSHRSPLRAIRKLFKFLFIITFFKFSNPFLT